MQIFRVITTVFDAWFILLIWMFWRSQKNESTKIGLSVMAALILANAFLIWR